MNQERRIKDFSPSLGSASFSEFQLRATSSEFEILTDLSLLDSFTEQEASQVTNNLDLSRNLKNLLAKQYLVLISTTPNRYLINNLIKDNLRDLLSKDENRFKSVSLKCATTLKETYPLKALEFYGLAGEVDSATKHITSNLHLFLLHSDIEVLLKWAPLIAKVLGGGQNREKLVKAYGLLASGKFDSLKSTIREIESGLKDDETSKLLLQDLIPLRLYIDFAYGNFPKILEYASQVVNSQKPLSELRNMTLLNRIILTSYFYLQDLKGFSSYLSKFDLYSNKDVSKIDLVHISSFKAMDSFLSGKYIEASEFALAACNLAEECEIEGAYFPFESAYILMDTYLEFGDEDKSQEFVDRYLQKALRTHQYSWAVAFYAKAALIKAQGGKIEPALSLIRKGREMINLPAFAPHISFVLDGNELIIRLPFGDMPRIKELLFKMAGNGNHRGVKTFNYSMEIMKNPANVEKIVPLMANETDQDVFHRELLLATVFVENRIKALGHLKKAIEIAVPNGYFRAFLNMPPNVKNLILEIAGGAPTNYLENLSKAIRNQTTLAAINSVAMDKPLTKQELVILRRLDSGLPISQIAKALSISRNTIKTHLRSIYRKLSAESRHDAVTRAKELMLL